MQILHPIPDHLIPAATALWRARFGALGWPRRIRADHGVVAVDQDGALAGVMGLRDAQGGLARQGPPVPDWLFCTAPPTADLVIDGLAVTRPRRGVGRALIARAARIAALSHHPGLRAEVRAANTGALAFYHATGFVPEGRGRHGPPWWGEVVLLRRTV